MRRVVFGLLCWLAASANGSPATSVIGLWASQGSIFHVYEENGALYSRIIALDKPFYTEAEKPGQAGLAKLDDENPDPALRSRPIIGLHMLADYHFEDGRWQGNIYDPESGNTYKSRMQINASGLLEIRGYIGAPMFGRTAVFNPASSCLPHITAMLKATEHASICAEASAGL